MAFEFGGSLQKPGPLRVAGLFAGIGGLELGLSRSGHSAVLLSEIAPPAQAVLRKRFPSVPLVGDVRRIATLVDCDLVAAGFPCQDLSQCGRTQGIDGEQSSLVREVFRLVENATRQPEWILLENVPFMLRLDRGRAMKLISSELTRLGYRWCYRTIDARAFGLPQRRLRVVLMASLSHNPLDILFADDEVEPPACSVGESYGFYWTEGSRGLGWGVDCVPTLKGGSSLGIPSPPAVWIPAKSAIGTIDIRDAERLQGFPVDWTKPALEVCRRRGVRWQLVGNAVCVRVAAWIGRRLACPKKSRCNVGGTLDRDASWPTSAYGDSAGVRPISGSSWPKAWKHQQLLDFLRFPLLPLSKRATVGFLSRAKNSRLRFADHFLSDVEKHGDSIFAP
ncbi:MAG: DNA cytosine methyltransferase [Planctomycetia bacterium]